MIRINKDKVKESIIYTRWTVNFFAFIENCYVVQARLFFLNYSKLFFYIWEYLRYCLFPVSYFLMLLWFPQLIFSKFCLRPHVIGCMRKNLCQPFPPAKDFTHVCQWIFSQYIIFVISGRHMATKERFTIRKVLV